MNSPANYYPRRIHRACQGSFALATLLCAATALPAAVIGPRLATRWPCLQPDDRVPVWVYLHETGRSRDEVYLSPRCVGRRLRTGVAPLRDRSDRLLAPEVVEQIVRTGARLRTVSRYLPAVSVDASREVLRRLSNLPHVAGLELVASGTWREPTVSRVARPLPAGLDYGASEPFLEQIQVTELHRRGFTGSGVLVAMLDTGYYMDHAALDELEVEGEWDFIHDDGCTQNESGQDAPNQHNHGTYTLSVIGAWDPGTMVGAAYDASFLLAKTEEVSSETPVEEDYWVEGLEWAEAMGADVVSSSLAYIDWYDYSDLDGQTAVTTRAACVAASKGVVVCTSMGNQGPAPGSLMAPADAESILSVGAVDLSGVKASFSSTGPTFDGRTKPDVMACGVSVVAATAGTDSSYGWVSGTSMAAPLVAGAVALLIEACPDWSPMELMETVRQSATRASNPDNEYGWGIVQALTTYLRTDTLLAVQGRALDARSAEGIETAWVGWRRAGEFLWAGPVFTGSTGRFTLSLEAGAYEVLVKALGYQETIGSLIVPAETCWEVSLEPVAVAAGPNPCSGVLHVSFGLATPGTAAVELWDLVGRRVAGLTRSGEPGALRLAWDLRLQGLRPGKLVLRWKSQGAEGSIPIVYTGGIGGR